MYLLITREIYTLGERTHVVVLLIRITLGVSVANSRPKGRKVPISRTIFFQGDRLRTKYFRFIFKEAREIGNSMSNYYVYGNIHLAIFRLT